MMEDDVFALIDPVLRAVGSLPEPGEEFHAPALDVLRYYRRPVRWHWLPVVGRGLGIVAIVRQPVDLGFTTEHQRTLLTRLAMAVNGRFPPWDVRRGGLVIGLTTIVLTSEPIGPEDDARLGTLLGRLARHRAVPLGMLRVNLGQEALSFALATDPDRLFPEPVLLADALTPHFRRFVPLLET